MRKFLTVLLAAAMLTGCFGCKPPEEDDGGHTPPPKPATVAQDYYIVAEEDATVQFAAGELAAFTEEMNGKETDVYTLDTVPGDREGFCLWLGTAAWARENLSSFDAHEAELEYDGFALVPGEEGLLVTSKLARGVSYGAYELLERNGVRFYASYEDGTFVPENGNVNYRLESAVVDNPDFEYRLFLNDTGSLPITDYGKEEMARLITWLYRNRYNQASGHNASYARYEVDGLLETLGVSYNGGGHKAGFPSTSQYPDWQRCDADGNRVPTGNFCVSQPDALMYVAQNILSAFHEEPKLDSFQMLGEDTYDGAWCHCDDCSAYTANQQFSLVVSVAAEKLAKEFPGKTIQYSLYHDTLDVSDLAPSALENVDGFYWPRERCLAHELGDPACEKSRTYLRYLRTMCEKFQHNSFCGYYGDMVLYNCMEANANAQVAADLKLARALGCKDTANLMFSMFGTTQSDEMMMTFGRCHWDTEADWRTYLIGYYADMFGADAAQAERIMDLRYAFTEDMFSFDGYSVDYGIEGIVMSDGEQDWAKKHVLMMAEAPGVMEELKEIYSSLKDASSDEAVRGRLERKLRYAELSRLRALSIASNTKGAYLKKFIWDADFSESYQDCYRAGIEYHVDSMEYAAQFDESTWGHNAFLIQNGLGEALTAFYRYKGDISG